MTTTYNITHNAKFDSYEVTFESKPATAVLDALKALKMRWNPKKACWYGFAKEHEIISAILENGEGETITGEKTEGATVYTDGYLGGGAVYGSKSNLHLYGADLSKAIREDIKRAGIKGVTVRCKSYSGGQSIGVTVTLRPDEYISFPEFLENYRIKGNSWIYTAENPHGILSDYYFEMSAQEQEETRVAAAEYDYERMTTRENRVNEFHIDEETQFTPETLAKIKTTVACFRNTHIGFVWQHTDSGILRCQPICDPQCVILGAIIQHQKLPIRNGLFHHRPDRCFNESFRIIRRHNHRHQGVVIIFHYLAPSWEKTTKTVFQMHLISILADRFSIYFRSKTIFSSGFSS
jgi:hypothetical protein